MKKIKQIHHYAVIFRKPDKGNWSFYILPSIYIHRMTYPGGYQTWITFHWAFWYYRIRWIYDYTED